MEAVTPGVHEGGPWMWEPRARVLGLNDDMFIMGLVFALYVVMDMDRSSGFETLHIL